MGMSNLNQAMYEMFGVGKEPGAESAPVKAAEPVAAAEETIDKLDVLAEETKEEVAPAVVLDDPYPPKKSYEKTYLAAGTCIVGTIKTEGDLEIAGEFTGDVVSGGNVTLHSGSNGNITAVSLKIYNSMLCGDVHATDRVEIGEGSAVNGNVFASRMVCAGAVKGDVEIKNELVLEKTAQFEGNIKTGTMSMASGAMVRGKLEMTGASDKWE